MARTAPGAAHPSRSHFESAVLAPCRHSHLNSAELAPRLLTRQQALADCNMILRQLFVALR